MLVWGLVAAALANCPRVDAEVVRFPRDHPPMLLMHGGAMHIGGALTWNMSINVSDPSGFTDSDFARRISHNAFRFSLDPDGRVWTDDSALDIRPGITTFGTPSEQVNAEIELRDGGRWLTLSADDHARVVLEADEDTQLDLLVTSTPIEVGIVTAGELLSDACACHPCLRVDDDARTIQVLRTQDPTLIVAARFGAPVDYGLMAGGELVYLPSLDEGGCRHTPGPGAAWLFALFASAFVVRRR